MKYPVPQYKPSVDTTSSPHYVFLVNYEAIQQHHQDMATTLLELLTILLAM
jgi:hypothetical protein